MGERCDWPDSWSCTMVFPIKRVGPAWADHGPLTLKWLIIAMQHVHTFKDDRYRAEFWHGSLSGWATVWIKDNCFREEQAVTKILLQ